LITVWIASLGALFYTGGCAWRQRHTGVVAAILPDGLFFRTWQYNDRIVPWSSIASMELVRFDHKRHWIDFHLLNGKTLGIRIPPYRIAMTEEFVQVSNRRLSDSGDTHGVQSE
ncbi:MAG: hypothetical protein ACPGXK_15315, partial [Phycisphaerae bacterium]